MVENFVRQVDYPIIKTVLSNNILGQLSVNIPSDERVRWFRCESGFRFRLEINEDYKYKVSIFISFKFLFYSIGVKFNSSELMMPVRWISYHDIGSRRSWGMSSTAEPSWSQIEDQIITRRYQMIHMTKTHWFILWLEREFNLLFTGEPIPIQDIIRDIVLVWRVASSQS